MDETRQRLKELIQEGRLRMKASSLPVLSDKQCKRLLDAIENPPRGTLVQAAVHRRVFECLSAAYKAIKTGKVTVNGSVVTNPDRPVSDKDVICFGKGACK